MGAEQLTLEREGGEWVESKEHSRDVAREPRAQGDCLILVESD